MAEELLDGADVVASDEQMGGEGVPQRVAARGFRDPCGSNRFLHGALDGPGARTVLGLV